MDLPLYGEDEETRTSIYRPAATAIYVPQRRRKPLRWWIAGSLTVVLVTATVFTARHSGSSEPPRPLTLTGALVAGELTAVTSEVDGRVAGVSVAVGRLVIAGEELLRLDPRPFEAELARARMSLRVARAEAAQAEARAGASLRAFRRVYLRVHRAQGDPDSDPEVRLARATLDLEQVRLEAARTHESDAAAVVKRVQAAREELVVRAPVDGELRELAAPGSRSSGALARIDRRPGHRELVSCVAPAPRLEVGQWVRLVLAGQTVRARVGKLEPGCSEGASRLRLEIEKAPASLGPSAAVSAQLYLER